MCDEHPSKSRRPLSELWRLIAVVALCLWIGVSVGRVATAEQLPKTEWTNFDIPAQSLASALITYGVQTRIPLFVDMNLVVGRRSVGLKGIFSSEAGLQSMLIGTGLVAVPIGNGFALIRAKPRYASADEESSQTLATASPFASYSALIQRRLKRALCARGETRPGSYRALVRLTIDNIGSVTRVRLLTSTGNPKLDALLDSTLRRVTLGEPPPGNLQQSVTLLLAPGAERTSAYCSESAVHGNPGAGSGDQN